MEKTSIKKYYIKNNIVYLLKETYKRNYLLKLSPPFKEKDRRIFIIKKSDLNGYKAISSQKAQEIVNKKWREVEEEWIFNGKTYKVLDCSDPRSSFDEKIVPIWIKEDNKTTDYFYCYNQGKVCIGMFYPNGRGLRMCLYKFKVTEDNKIIITKSIKWTSPKNCKVIYEVLSNGDLKMI